MPGTVDYVIQDKSDNKQSYKTKYHTSPVMEYHIAGTDDNEVASHNHASQRDILVFMDDGCNDVRTSRAAVAVEHDTRPAPHIAAPIRQAMKSCPSPSSWGGRRPNRSPATGKTIRRK